jgi:hypothetical protein
VWCGHGSSVVLNPSERLRGLHGTHTRPGPDNRLATLPTSGPRPCLAARNPGDVFSDVAGREYAHGILNVEAAISTNVTAASMHMTAKKGKPPTLVETKQALSSQAPAKSALGSATRG